MLLLRFIPNQAPKEPVDCMREARYAGRRCIRLNEKAYMLLCRVAAPRMIADEASHGAFANILIGIEGRIA